MKRIVCAFAVARTKRLTPRRSPIGNTRGNCRCAFAITALTNISPRGLIVPIIAAAIINFIIAPNSRSAAVISAAAIAIGTACFAAIRRSPCRFVDPIKHMAGQQ
jgi:hypothetical protein